MGSAIVQSTEIVTLIGAGRLNQTVFTESLHRSGTVVAADGGVKAALSFGVVPEAVIGDLDSVDDADRAQLPPGALHHIAEQDSTDFEKAIGNINAPLILAAGFTGGRIDHELASYNALVRHEGCPIIVLGDEDICFHLSSKLTLHLPAGSRLSLFPMAELKCASTGLKWATDHLTFSPNGRVGTSNEVAQWPVLLSPSARGMMVILPMEALDSVIAALTD